MSADPQTLALDLTAQRTLLASRELSSEALVAQTLEAIAASQPVLNAYLSLDADAALSAARECDARLAAGSARALEGLPVAIKDNLDVAGMRTTAGMATRRDAPAATADSTAVARLREAGAVILGKLNMHEAALGADNDNPHFGACRNPHRPTHTPGGSSGGSGAAVAAALCSAALGTDSMGSVRIPAAYCGVAGLKPGRGVVSTRGSVELSRRLDHVGPLARSARDLRPLLQVLAGFDADSAQSRAIAFSDVADRPLRLGVIDFAGSVDSDAEVQRVFDAGLRTLLDLGHARVDLPGPALAPGKARRAGLLVCEAELLIEHAADWQAHRDRFSPQLAAMMAWAEGKTAADFVAADRVLDAAQVLLLHWLARCDVIVAPTTPQQAFAFGEAIPANQADYTCYANIAGVPALSVPMPVGDGELPVGLQLIGREGSELQLIALAEAFEQAHAQVWRLPEACRQWWPA